MGLPLHALACGPRLVKSRMNTDRSGSPIVLSAWLLVSPAGGFLFLRDESNRSRPGPGQQTTVAYARRWYITRSGQPTDRMTTREGEPSSALLDNGISYYNSAQ